MRVGSFLALTALTVVVTGAAAVAIGNREAPRTEVVAAGPVFPGLGDRLNEVAAVVVRDAGTTITIRRTPTGWVLAERGDYPVRPDRVRDLARALTNLEKAEARTTRPDLYARIGVEDPTASGARSKEVALQTADGAPLARLIVGNAATGVAMEPQTFVRVAGEEQAWLTRGALTVSSEPGEWVERRLLELPVADIREVRITRADRSTITAVRQDTGTGFRLAELKPNGRLKRPDAAEAIPLVLSDLQLEDLSPAADVAFPPQATVQVTATMTDGRVVAFDLAEVGGERWLRFLPDRAPSTLPEAGRDKAFRVLAWKTAPLERPLSDLVESGSGS